MTGFTTRLHSGGAPNVLHMHTVGVHFIIRSYVMKIENGLDCGEVSINLPSDESDYVCHGRCDLRHPLVNCVIRLCVDPTRCKKSAFL